MLTLNCVQKKKKNVDIEYNNGNTRPVCTKCGLRCIYTLVYYTSVKMKYSVV